MTKAKHADAELASLYLRLYFDEDVPAAISKNLRTRGFDVTAAREITMLGRSDEEQMAYAVEERRTIVTHNLVDFEALHRRFMEENRHHYGIVVAKRRRNDEIVIGKLLELLDTVTADEMRDQCRYL